MRVRTTALVVAIAMTMPAAVLAGRWSCATDLVSSGDCCCGGESGQAAPTGPTADRTCCCEVNRPSQAGGRHDAPATVESDDDARETATSGSGRDVRYELAQRGRLPAQARGPPPPRTLLALRVALLC